MACTLPNAVLNLGITHSNSSDNQHELARKAWEKSAAIDREIFRRQPFYLSFSYKNIGMGDRGKQKSLGYIRNFWMFWTNIENPTRQKAYPNPVQTSDPESSPESTQPEFGVRVESCRVISWWHLLFLCLFLYVHHILKRPLLYRRCL